MPTSDERGPQTSLAQLKREVSLGVRAILRFCLLAFSFFLPVCALAADAIKGTVTNGTANKPAAGDEVVLIRLQQNMQESTRTKTDARGRFTLQVPDDGMHLVRVTHDKTNYFRPAPPGTQSVEVMVYDAAEKVEGVSTNVEELHVEATATELHIVEVLQVINQSTPQRTQFGPAGYEFYLPPDAHIARTGAVTEGGMPVQTPAVPAADPGHYRFLFPLRPGETQFGIVYSLPYSGNATLNLKLAGPVNTLAVLVPASMKLAPGGSSSFALQPRSGGAQAQTWMAQHVSTAQTMEFTVSGTGTLPQEDAGSGQGNSSAQSSGQPLPETENTMPGRGLQNPLDPEGTRDPWAKYKWWILGGLAVLLAAAAGVLLKKPAAPAATFPVAGNAPGNGPLQNRGELLLQALKEELFALETDHLQGRIPETEYREARNALELVLRRSLQRSGKPAVQPADAERERASV